jgi:hypothetical protein
MKFIHILIGVIFGAIIGCLIWLAITHYFSFMMNGDLGWLDRYLQYDDRDQFVWSFINLFFMFVFGAMGGLITGGNK